MCKRNFFCFCVFSLLLSSFLLFSCGSATVSAEKQLQKDTTENEIGESHEEINKELLRIYTVYCEINKFQSFVSKSASELYELLNDVSRLMESSKYPNINKMPNKLRELKGKTETTNEEMAQLSTKIKSDYCQLNNELLKKEIDVLGTRVFTNINIQTNVIKNVVTQQLQAVNDLNEITELVKKEAEFINTCITQNQNPEYKEMWTTQKETLESFLTRTDEAENAAKMVKQKTDELVENLPKLDKIIKAEQSKRKQDQPVDEKPIEAIEEKKEDMKEDNGNINESTQQSAETGKTEKNEGSITDTLTVKPTTKKDDNNQQTLEKTTTKTNEHLDTLNNQTFPNNNTKKDQSLLTLGDSAVRVIMDLLCFMLFGVFTLLGRYVY